MKRGNALGLGQGHDLCDQVADSRLRRRKRTKFCLPNAIPDERADASYFASCLLSLDLLIATNLSAS